jgi:hypothetical protein
MSYPSLMANDSIVSLIDAEIARLTQVRTLLANSANIASRITLPKTAAAQGKKRKKRVLSADARKRIADAQRKRWALQKAKKAK